MLNVKHLSTIMLLTVGVSFTSACGVKIGNEDKKNSKMAACAMADMLVSELRVGGAVSKTAAGIVKNNTKDQHVKNVATSIQKGSNTVKNRNILIRYIQRSC